MKIAIASGKGGTGKTLVATNLFYTFQRMGLSVSLVDCDVEGPNALNFFQLHKVKVISVKEYCPKFDLQQCIYCGRCADYCDYNAIFIIPNQSQLHLLSHLCHGCGACAVACNNGAIEDSEIEVGIVSLFSTTMEREKAFLVEGRINEGEHSATPVIKAAINQGDSLNTDFLILDSPPGVSCPFIQTVAKTDYVVLVTEPTPFGLSDLRQAVETLKHLHKPFGVIINRVGLGNHDVYDYLEKEHIALLAEIPFDKKVAHLYSEGNLLVTSQPIMSKYFESISKKIIKNGNSSC
ncbi:MAG: ATP-binding protein [Bacteroidaceae bacterium]|nr:ATP-binding protein [Bacteroidaceae bacterium]